MDKNRFILSLKYGYEHQYGFKYSDIKLYIEKEGDIRFKREDEFAFRLWFAEAFFNPVLQEDYDNRKFKIPGNYGKMFTDETLPFQGIVSDDKNLFFIKGDSIIQYLDYLELKVARKHANSANKHANSALRFSRRSVIIALGALAISGISSLLPYIFPYPTSSPTPHNSLSAPPPSSSDSSLMQIDSSQNKPDASRVLLDTIPADTKDSY